MPLRVCTNAEKLWARLGQKVLNLIWYVIYSRTLAAKSMMFRMAVSVASAPFKDEVEEVATGSRRPPPTRQVPKAVAKAMAEKAQVTCTHKNDKGTDAIKVYGAGRHGYYAKCQECERRWKWNLESGEWVDPPGSSKASSPPVLPLGAQAKARPSSRTSASASSAPSPPSTATRRIPAFRMDDWDMQPEMVVETDGEPDDL